MQNKTSSLITLLALLSTIYGCAVPFDRPIDPIEKSQSPSGNTIFDNTLEAHGGDPLNRLTDLSVGLTGEWPFLIKRIQPLVTDFKYRVASEERLLVGQGIYTALYTGPSGTKKVIRNNKEIRVFYNNEESFDENVLQSSAMTADAFYMFLLGPLALTEHAGKFVRLQDITEKGNDYFRIYAVLEPGFGYSPRDELILWVDKKTNLTFRVNITLEGYESTKGAHVDVTFLEYQEKMGFQLPVKFHERVLGPVRIKAHDWQLIGLDVNRGYSFEDLNRPGWSTDAAKNATPVDFDK